MKNQKILTKASPEVVESQILPILKKVFNYPGSFLHLFKARLSFRIIDENYGLMPSRNLLGALKTIGMGDGYNGFYYVFVDYGGPPHYALWLQDEIKNQNVEGWYVPFDKIEEAQRIHCVFCQALISPIGDWGIFITRDNFLLLGCTPEVGSHLQQLIPELENSIYRFFKVYKMMEQEFDARWEMLPSLIHHLYGSRYDDLIKNNF